MSLKGSFNKRKQKAGLEEDKVCHWPAATCDPNLQRKPKLNSGRVESRMQSNRLPLLSSSVTTQKGSSEVEHVISCTMLLEDLCCIFNLSASAKN